MDIMARLRTFVLEAFMAGQDAELNPDTLLFESGILDSGGMLELLAFIEEKFDVVLTDDELAHDNLSSLGKLTALIQSKIGV